MIRHIFLWRLADKNRGDEVLSLLGQLSEGLDFIRGWDMGKQMGEPGGNGDPWDGGLITDFDTWEDLARYSDAPLHVEVVEKLLPLVSDRAVVDYEKGI